MNTDIGSADGKAFWGLAAIGAAALLTWTGWISFSVMEKPDRQEVQSIASQAAPYNHDRVMILGAIAEMKESIKDLQITNKELATANYDRTERLTEAINNNTKALVELRTIVNRGLNN